MKKFNLQIVLDYRQRLEDTARLELSKAQEKLRALCAEAEAAKLSLEELYAEFEKNQREGISPHEFILYRNHISMRHSEIEKLIERQQLAETELEQRRAELLDASMKKQIMEKFKDKKDLEFQKFLQGKENIFLDEIAIQHFKR